MSTPPVHDTKQQKFALISKQRETLKDAIRRHEREIQTCKQSLRDLDSQWNTVTDVGRLPDEILIDIWSYFSDSSGDSLDQPFEWLGITHVCSRWRELALSTPSLWRSPYMMIPDVAKIFIERAGNGPFNVCLDLGYIDAMDKEATKRLEDSEEAFEIVTLACSLFHQMRSLTIEAADTMCTYGIYASGNFLLSLEKYGTFPLLKEISLSYDKPPELEIAMDELDVDGLILSAPALQRLYLGNRCMFTFPLKIAPKTLPITFLELDLDLDPTASDDATSHQIHLHEMMQILGMLPFLRTLYLTNPFKSICEGDEEWARTHTAPIFLKQLLSLYLKIDIGGTAFFLAHVHFPPTTHVEISHPGALPEIWADELEAFRAFSTATSKIKDLGNLTTRFCTHNQSGENRSGENGQDVSVEFHLNDASKPNVSLQWQLQGQPPFSCIPSIFGFQNLKKLLYSLDYSDVEMWKAFGSLPALTTIECLDPCMHPTAVRVLSIFRFSGESIFEPFSSMGEDADLTVEVAGVPQLYFPNLVEVGIIPNRGYLASMEELDRIMLVRSTLDVPLA